MSRQDRRRNLRSWKVLGKAALIRGLPYPPRREATLGVALQLRDKLGETRNTARAAQVGEIALRLYTLTKANDPAPAAVACKEGCAYCCHLSVTATAPEIFAIAARLRAERTPDAVQGLIEAAGRTANLDRAARVAGRLPCMLLEEGRCTVYASRPISCRSLLSREVEPCIETYEGREAAIPVPRAAAVIATDCRFALCAALLAAGLAFDGYELSAGLRVALGDADAEAKWLAGEAVFDGVRKDDARTPDAEREIRWFAEQMA